VDADGRNPRSITSAGVDAYACASWSAGTAHVARSLIGANGSDTGANPVFGRSRPLVVVGLRRSGLVESVTVDVPLASWGTVTASGIEGTGYELAGVQIEADQVTGVLEDLGRGVSPRLWNTASGLVTKSVAVFFDAETATISSVLATTVSASSADVTASPRTHVEGDRVIVTGPFEAVWTAPDTNLAPNGATEVEMDATTGEILAVR
jgi:hypothetical protein